MKVLWTRTAFDRLNEINTLLEETGHADARLWRKTALAAAVNLTAFPESGTSVAEVDGDGTFRQIRLGDYRMIYRVDGLIIYIMTFHIHRDPVPGEQDGGDEFPNN
jgi:plasmid stabilization system protein ParE